MSVVGGPGQTGPYVSVLHYYFLNAELNETFDRDINLLLQND